MHGERAECSLVHGEASPVKEGGNNMARSANCDEYPTRLTLPRCSVSHTSEHKLVVTGMKCVRHLVLMGWLPERVLVSRDYRVNYSFRQNKSKLLF